MWGGLFICWVPMAPWGYLAKQLDERTRPRPICSRCRCVQWHGSRQRLGNPNLGFRPGHAMDSGSERLDSGALTDSGTSPDSGSIADAGFADAAQVDSGAMDAGQATPDAGNPSCTYPPGAVEPMAFNEVLTAHSWPAAIDGMGNRFDLDLTKCIAPMTMTSIGVLSMPSCSFPSPHSDQLALGMPVRWPRCKRTSLQQALRLSGC